MDSDNVVQLPTRLERLAKEIHLALAAAKQGKAACVENTVIAAVRVLEAREDLKSDQEFGKWWSNEDFDFDKNDRAALIAMGAHPEIMKAVLTETDRTSLRHIYAEYRGRFPHVGKPQSRHNSDPPSRRSRHTATPPQPKRLDPDRSRPLETRAREAVRAAKDAGLPVNVRDIGTRIGVSHVIVEQAAAMERAVEEDRRNPIVDPESLSLTAQKKLSALQHRLEENAKRTLAAWRLQLDEEVHKKVLENTADQRKTLEEATNKAYKEHKQYTDLINNFKPIYTVEEWEVLRRVTHPDNSAGELARNRAFNLVVDKKLQLTGKK